MAKIKREIEREGERKEKKKRKREKPKKDLKNANLKIPKTIQRLFEVEHTFIFDSRNFFLLSEMSLTKIFGAKGLLKSQKV